MVKTIAITTSIPITATILKITLSTIVFFFAYYDDDDADLADSSCYCCCFDSQNLIEKPNSGSDNTKGLRLAPLGTASGPSNLKGFGRRWTDSNHHR